MTLEEHIQYSPSEDDVKGVSDEERIDYMNIVKKIEEEQGQVSQTTYAIFAIDSLKGAFLLDDVNELSMASERTNRRAIKQQKILDNIYVADYVETDGRDKPVYMHQ